MVRIQQLHWKHTNFPVIMAIFSCISDKDTSCSVISFLLLLLVEWLKLQVFNAHRNKAYILKYVTQTFATRKGICETLRLTFQIPFQALELESLFSVGKPHLHKLRCFPAFHHQSCASAYTFTPQVFFFFTLPECRKKQGTVYILLMLRLGEESAFVEKTLAGLLQSWLQPARGEWAAANPNIFAKEDLAVVFLKAYELFLESDSPAKLQFHTASLELLKENIFFFCF